MIPLPETPQHPGRILEDRLAALGIEATQEELADRLGISRRRLNELVKGRRGVTPDTALRLGRLLGTPPEFWLHAQAAWDLRAARHSRATMRELARIEPVAGAASGGSGAAAAGARSTAPARADLGAAHAGRRARAGGDEADGGPRTWSAVLTGLPDPPDAHRLQAELHAKAREHRFLLEFLERRGLAAEALRYARIRTEVTELEVRGRPSDPLDRQGSRLGVSPPSADRDAPGRALRAAIAEVLARRS